MYSYCSSMYSYCCLCILIVGYVFLDAATLTEVFPCFFLGCKANARVILAKTGHGPNSSKIFVLFYVLFVLYCSMYCLCVNAYCHRVTTQLQLTNISYHIIYSTFGNNRLYATKQLCMSHTRRGKETHTDRILLQQRERKRPSGRHTRR